MRTHRLNNIPFGITKNNNNSLKILIKYIKGSQMMPLNKVMQCLLEIKVDEEQTSLWLKCLSIDTSCINTISNHIHNHVISNTVHII